MQTSVLFAIRSKVVTKAGPQTKGTKKLSGYLLLRKLIPGTTTGWKRTPPKTRLPSKIFWIDFYEIAPIKSILHGWIGCKPKKRPMSRTIHFSDDSIPSKHRSGRRPTIQLRWKLCSSLQGWTSQCNKKSANNQACQEQRMIWLPLERSSDQTWIVSPNRLCQRILILRFPLLLNLGEVMLLLPAFSMKTAVGKRSFAPIVKEKAAKRRNIGRNLAMLSNAKGPGPVQLEHKLP